MAFVKSDWQNRSGSKEEVFASDIFVVRFLTNEKTSMVSNWLVHSVAI